MTRSTDMATKHAKAAAPMFARDGYRRTEARDVTANDLERATVFGRGDKKFGSVSSLKVATDGTITDAVIDVVGLLGMDARSVSLPFSDLTVLRKNDGHDVRVYIDTVKEKLKTMPRREG